MQEKSYVYILRCADGTLYTGWTNDPARRLRAHNAGKGAKYTKPRRPVTLVYQEACRDKAAGLRREYEIKRLSRAQKLALIQAGAGKTREETRMEYPMRRKSRERGEEFALAVLKHCPYATFATVNEDGSPYCVPVSPVYCEGAVYFHCAPEGHKLDNIRNHPQVCLCCAVGVVDVPEHFTTKYQSCVIFGRAELVEKEEEKIMALRKLCEKHAASNLGQFETEVNKSLPRTAVCKITIERITGKQKGKEVVYGAGSQG